MLELMTQYRVQEKTEKEATNKIMENANKIVHNDLKDSSVMVKWIKADTSESLDRYVFSDYVLLVKVKKDGSGLFGVRKGKLNYG